jgi:hypothetical protein
LLHVGDFDRFLFIAGAPRCGTTTLFHFLKANAAVASPIVKEPHFFSQNDLRAVLDSELPVRVERDYLRRFFRRDPNRRIGMDASVTYLYAPEQLEPVLKLWPDARFVVSFRDPMTMLPSLHRRLVYIGDETIERFEDAWAAIPDRRAGRRIPERCADPRWLFYDEAARFATYLERLFAAVGRERCLVVLFDDLVAEPAQQYARLIEFTDLQPTPDINFAARRASYGLRSIRLQRLLKRPPAAMQKLLAGEKYWERLRDLDATPDKRTTAVLSVRKRLLAWNRIPAPRERLSPHIRREIRDTFGGEVSRLGKLIGRDLSHWLQTGE